MEMIEKAYRILDLIQVVGWVEILAEGYCMQYYFGCFLDSRFGKGRKNRVTGFLVVAVAILCEVFQRALELAGFTGIGKRALGYVCCFACIFLVGAVFYRIHRWKTVFVMLSFTSVYLLGGLLVSMEYLLDLEVRGFLGDWLEAGRISLTAYAWMWVALSVLQAILGVAVFYWLLRRIAKNFREKEMELHGKELLQLLMPSLTALCLYMLLTIVVYGTEEGFFEVYASNPFLCMVVSMILILSLLSVLYGVTMFQDVYALNRERKGRAVLEKQISVLQEYVGERERIWFGLRSMKHDMRNTLAVAMRLAGQGGETERLQAYLGQLNLSLEAFETEFRTGNTVADALLDMKCHEARKLIPELNVDVEELVFPGTLAIQDYDIGVILGNALDNAVEACVRLKEEDSDASCFIRMSSFLEGQMFLLEIKNNFDGKTIIKEGGEFPETRKRDGESHGIGLPNIKNTCEKYHGAVEWSVWEGVFTLSVMLRNVDLRAGGIR